MQSSFVDMGVNLNDFPNEFGMAYPHNRLKLRKEALFKFVFII